MQGTHMIGVTLQTQWGAIVIELHTQQAPLSSQVFLRWVDDGSFGRAGMFYRTVRSRENDHGSPPIDVIQGGLVDLPELVAGVEHEPTSQSGLRHLDGTVSLARGVAGSATGAAFFICIGDQPALDAGGRRQHDGLGFAAFARVSEGMGVVRQIHREPTSSVAPNAYQQGQRLQDPVRIQRAIRHVWRHSPTSDPSPQGTKHV
jgi:peptidyl-prolyl cis-trans isomerase A (cyclophilin A)